VLLLQSHRYRRPLPLQRFPKIALLIETSCSAGAPLRMKKLRLVCVQDVFRILCWRMVSRAEGAHELTDFTLLCIFCSAICSSDDQAKSARNVLYK
jgi:hypothetical protein